MDIYTNTQVEEIKKDGKGIIAVAKDKATGKQMEFPAQRIMVAVGRRSNADLLKVENTGVELDKRGFIKVDEYLETH